MSLVLLVRSVLSAGVVLAPAVIAVVAGAIFVTAGVTGLIAPLFPQAAAVDEHGLQVEGGLAVLVGVALLGWRRRVPGWSAHLLVLTGIVAITVAIELAGPTPTGVALASYYVFIALDCGLFFAPLVGATYITFTVGVCLVALTHQSPQALGAGVTLGATAVVVAVGIRWLAAKAAAAEVDALTGLPNRRHLDQALPAAVEHARRTGRPLAVAHLDVDHFKSANDTYGHAHGDRLLRAVARAWRDEVDSPHLLARHGGDEFVLVLTGVSTDEVTAITERLHEAVPTGHTCSIGVATLVPTDSLSALARRADVALYEAKRLGRDRTVRHEVMGSGPA